MNYKKFMEPITYENIHELKEGDWIWDDKAVSKRAHGRHLHHGEFMEAAGFRQIHILDIENFPRFSVKPFYLSGCNGVRDFWEYFEPERFYKFRTEVS